MYNRIMRLVVPIIMGTFLIIGLVLLLGIRANSQDALTQSRHADITDFVRGINGEIQRRVDSVSGLAGERDAREFARDTLVNTASTTVNDSQTRLLGDFTNLLQQNPTYLAVALRHLQRLGLVGSHQLRRHGSARRCERQTGEVRQRSFADAGAGGQRRVRWS